MSQKSSWRSNSNESRNSNSSKISKSSKNSLRQDMFDNANAILENTNIPNDKFIAKSRKIVNSINIDINQEDNSEEEDEDDGQMTNEVETSSYWTKWRSKTDSKNEKSLRSSFSSTNANDKNKQLALSKDDGNIIKTESQSSLTSMGWFSSWKKNQNIDTPSNVETAEQRDEDNVVFEDDDDDVERQKDIIKTKRNSNKLEEEEIQPIQKKFKPQLKEKIRSKQNEGNNFHDTNGIISKISTKSLIDKSASRSGSKGSQFFNDNQKDVRVVIPALNVKSSGIKQKNSAARASNEISLLKDGKPIIGTTSGVQIANNLKSDERFPSNAANNTWWNSIFVWRSGVSDYPESPMSDVDDSLELSDAKKMRKILQSYGEEDQCCWAINITDFQLYNGGELSILGTSSESCPAVLFSNLKRTKMEHYDQDTSKSGKIFKKPELVPKVDVCYRTITMKTQARLFIDSLVCKSENHSINNKRKTSMLGLMGRKFNEFVPIERHVYHEEIQVPKNNSSHKSGKSQGTPVILMKKRVLIVNIQQFVPRKLHEFMDDKFSSSTKSAKAVQKAILDWNLGRNTADKRSNSNSEKNDNEYVEVETILLRGKGTILEQVENFFAILTKNWIFKFDKCDYLLFTGNFMASNIAVHLLKKLMDKYARIFDKIDKIGMVVVNGTFNGLLNEGINGVEESTNEPNNNNLKDENEEEDKSKKPRADCTNSDLKLNKKKSVDSAGSVKKSLDDMILRELKILSHPETELSYNLNHDLKVLLSKNNFKICLIGQLEELAHALYSSLCLQFQHPNITRMVFFDNDEAKLKLSKFVIKLIEVCLTLRNLGYEDYNFLVYLSQYLNDFYRLNENKYNGSNSGNNGGTKNNRKDNGTNDNQNETYEELRSAYECTNCYEEAIKFCFETTKIHSNCILDTSISQLPVVVEDEEQMEESKALQQGWKYYDDDGRVAYLSNGSVKNDFLFNKNQNANRREVMNFQKVNFPELVKNFNDFHYPWMLNKLVKEMYRVNGVDVRAMVLEMRRLMREWQPQDAVSQGLRSCMEVITVEDYLSL